MSKTYVCKKGLTLLGRPFAVGEIVTMDYLPDGRSLALQRSGYIAEINSGIMDAASDVILPEVKTTPHVVTIPIIEDEGQMMALPMTEEQLVAAVEVLQMNADKAINAIEDGIGDENILIFIHACDSRKTVKAAVVKKAGSIEEDDGGTPKDDSGDESKGE